MGRPRPPWGEAVLGEPPSSEEEPGLRVQQRVSAQALLPRAVQGAAVEVRTPRVVEEVHTPREAVEVRELMVEEEVRGQRAVGGQKPLTSSHQCRRRMIWLLQPLRHSCCIPH